jgi:hypothetical protein
VQAARKIFDRPTGPSFQEQAQELFASIIRTVHRENPRR